MDKIINQLQISIMIRHILTIIHMMKNSSMARDNEARRLEEMNYAMQPERNVSDLIIDSKGKLNEYNWMCAETSFSSNSNIRNR